MLRPVVTLRSQLEIMQSAANQIAVVMGIIELFEVTIAFCTVWIIVSAVVRRINLSKIIALFDSNHGLSTVGSIRRAARLLLGQSYRSRKIILGRRSCSAHLTL